MVKLPSRGLKTTKIMKPEKSGYQDCGMCIKGKIGGKSCNACSGRGKRYFNKN
jgi:hypothetical protein